MEIQKKYCTYCHSSWNTYNKNSACPYCFANDDWWKTDKEKIDKFNSSHDYTVNQYIKEINRIRKDGIQYYIPHVHKAVFQSFQQESIDYPFTEEECIEIIEKNFEIIIDAVINRKSTIDIEKLFPD